MVPSIQLSAEHMAGATRHSKLQTQLTPPHSASKQHLAPISTPQKYCSQLCRRRASYPSSTLDTVIVEIFRLKLDSSIVKTGVTCDSVATAVKSSLESTPRELESALPTPHDLRERVRCVARRSVVLITPYGEEIKGKLAGVKAVTPQGKVMTGEQLSTWKGDFGLRHWKGSRSMI
jgi:hypothetical protein